MNALNQLTNAGTTALGYDARGNLSQSGSGNYGYTSENRLATAPGGVFMAWNPLGLRHWVSGNPSDVTWMQYDGDHVVTELAGAAQVQRRYVYGPGMDEPLVWYEGAGTGNKRYLHADERGSVVAVSDGNGNAVAINRYDEYGIPQPGNMGPFGYTGQRWLPEVGLYDYKTRMYSPTLGRFMQTDPIGYGDGLNWYNYVGSDPINRADPSGQKKGCVEVTGTRIPDCSGRAAARSFMLRLLAAEGGDELGDAGGGVLLDLIADYIVGNGSFSNIVATISNTLRLQYETVDRTTMPVASWEVRWTLNEPSDLGGYVIQHVFSSRDKMNYWEAWHISAGSRITDFARAGRPYDDSFMGISGIATARFYEGLTLPSTFVGGSVREAGILQATYIRPRLPMENSTPMIYRRFP